MLQYLILHNFRSYSHKEFFFNSNLNVIKGPNGCGKTNIIEALHLLSTGRSFRTSIPKQMIKHGESSFYIEIGFESNHIEQTLSLAFDGKNKVVKHNQKVYSTFSSVLGIFPMIVFAPQDIHILSGAPSERRKFLNLHIAHSDPLYVHHLARFAKALKHRNAVLRKKETHLLSPFEIEMSKSSMYLMKVRKNCINALNAQLDVQRKLLNIEDRLKLVYEPSLPCEDANEIRRALEKHRAKDLMLGSTQLGTHRDDIDLLYNEKSAKHYSSEGQKRKFIAALKASELHEIYERQGSCPLYAIDDFTAHLDSEKQQNILSHVAMLKQAIVTTPSDIERLSQNEILLQESYNSLR